jgi:hypothetical protein
MADIVSVETSAPQQGKPWSVGTTLGILVLFIIVIALAGIFAPTSIRLAIWIGTLILLSVFLLVLGRGITGQWLGFLIDNTNKMSLSRLQLGLWLILIVSAFLAAALSNLHIVIFNMPVNNMPVNALSITIPQELLALFGVSATALVGTSAILNVKNSNALQSKNGKNIATKGSRYDAKWYDIFKGDDAANAAYVDLSKVQMFYITIILVLVYGVALGAMFTGVGGGVDPTTLAITAFPPLSATMVTLLGISQAGYLVYKAVPRNQPPNP